MKASNYQEIAKAAVLVGGLAAAGVLSAGQDAQAQFIGTQSQSRVSAALTSILTDGNSAATNSFAIEQVLPSSDYVFSGPVTVQASYVSQAIGMSNVVGAVIGTAVLSATVAANASTTVSVDRAVANAISGAQAASRYGDVSGIVRAWTSGTSVLD